MSQRLSQRLGIRPQVQTYQESLYRFLSRGRVLASITVLPAILILSFLVFLPILWAIWASFHSIFAFSNEWTFVGLENYSTLLGMPEYWHAVSRSLVFAVGGVTLQLIAGTALALALNKSFRFGTVIRAMFFLPYLIPTVILGYIALWMGNTQWGIINDVLLRLHLIDQQISWFGSIDLAMAAVIVTSSWKLTIFVTIMVLARLQGIPDNLYDAARTAGASSYQMFRDITLPNLKSVIFIVLLLRGVWTFNKFDIIWVLTAGGPLDTTRTAPIFAYEIGFRRAQLGMANAVSVTLFVLLIAVAIVYFVVFSPEEEVRVE